MRWLAVLLALLPAGLAGGCGPLANPEFQKYRQSKAQELVAQYERARRSNDALDQCVKAKLVAIAYGEAGSSGDEQAWRAREALDCKVAYERLAPAAEGVAGGVNRMR